LGRAEIDMLKTENIGACVGGKPILKGRTLEVPATEAYAVTGLDRGIVDKSGLILSSGTF